MAGRGIVQELTRRIKWNPLFRKLANRSVPFPYNAPILISH